MNTKLISERALAVIDQYLRWGFGNTSCSIPYFNNRKNGTRAGLRALVGKGSPREIFEEVENAFRKNGFSANDLDSGSLKAFLADSNIGIDCSGLAYYILDEECLARGKGHLDKNLSFGGTKGIFGKLRARLRPVENTGVTVFADNKNSFVIKKEEVQPGDMIILLGGPENGERDHIMVIHQVDYQNFKPISIHYTHAISWPSDGKYNHGVRQGIVNIINPENSLIEDIWIENEKSGEENYTLSRAKSSKAEIRRLLVF